MQSSSKGGLGADRLDQTKERVCLGVEGFAHLRNSKRAQVLRAMDTLFNLMNLPEA